MAPLGCKENCKRGWWDVCGDVLFLISLSLFCSSFPTRSGVDVDVSELVWSSVGETMGETVKEGVEPVVSTCRWNPLNKQGKSVSKIDVTCSNVIRDLFDDACFMDVLSTLTPKQRAWMCRLMSEKGCEFIRGDCNVVLGLGTL